MAKMTRKSETCLFRICIGLFQFFTLIYILTFFFVFEKFSRLETLPEGRLASSINPNPQC